jgi:hypothetical protein
MNDYILPIASPFTLGGIKIGVGLQIESNGTLNVTNTPVADGAYNDIIVSANGTIYTIAANVVTNSKLYQMNAGTVKANLTGSPAQPSDVTLASFTSSLAVFTGDSGSGGVKGLVPAPAAGDSAAGKFLKADGTWSVPSGGGGGGATWGSITGTLALQTDLQNALNAKFDDPTGTTAQYLRGDGSLATFPSLTGFVPYTGATTNVDLGEYGLKAGQLTLDTTPTGVAVVGTTRWNDSLGSSETTLKGGSVILKDGVDLIARVVNKVTPNTTLTKAAYQVVKVNGAQGGRLAVKLAQANNDNNSADTLGIVIETIPTNQEGFIMTVGQLEGINTTGSLQGETWADGDVIYLSPTTPGGVTKVKPNGSTGHIVIIGYVEYAHAVNGKLYIKIMNGWELDELHNVYINPGTLANNDALIYESSTQLWKNKTIASALGYTPVTTARSISTTAPLSGGGDLTINRTLSISQASGVTDGYISAADYTTFTNKGNADITLQASSTTIENSTHANKLYVLDASSGGFDITTNPILLNVVKRTITLVKTDKTPSQVKFYPPSGYKFNNGVVNAPLIISNPNDVATIYFDGQVPNTTSIIATIKHYPVKFSLTANGSFKVPAGYMIKNVIIKETAAGTVTLNFGTTPASLDVIAGLAITPGSLTVVKDADLLLRIFDTLSGLDQTIYVEAQLPAGWGGAALDMSIEIEQVL